MQEADTSIYLYMGRFLKEVRQAPLMNRGEESCRPIDPYTHTHTPPCFPPLKGGSKAGTETIKAVISSKSQHQPNFHTDILGKPVIFFSPLNMPAPILTSPPSLSFWELGGATKLLPFYSSSRARTILPRPGMGCGQEWILDRIAWVLFCFLTPVLDSSICLPGKYKVQNRFVCLPLRQLSAQRGL